MNKHEIVILRTISYILCVLLLSVDIINRYSKNNVSIKSSSIFFIAIIWSLYIDHLSENTKELKRPKDIVSISLALYSIVGLALLMV